MKNFRDLIVWQRAVDLVVEIYRLTSDWPPDERYGLTQQIRRAAVSVPANIAEGHGRRSDRELARFLLIANGSIRELETHMIIGERLGYSSGESFVSIQRLANEVGRLNQGLLRALRASEHQN